MTAGAYVLVAFLLLPPSSRVAEQSRTAQPSLTACTARGSRWRGRDQRRAFVCVPRGSHFVMPR